MRELMASWKRLREGGPSNHRTIPAWIWNGVAPNTVGISKGMDISEFQIAEKGRACACAGGRRGSVVRKRFSTYRCK
jgi:hypothetical protein